MPRKSTFGLLGSSFSGGFFSHLLAFSILVIAVIFPAAKIFPDLSAQLALELAETEYSSFYMVFAIILTGSHQIIRMVFPMVIAAVAVSPLAGGVSAYLSDNAFKGRSCSLKNAFRFAFKNYLRLLGTYALYVLIVLASLGAFAVFMYYFMHEWSHVYMERYMVPVLIGWIAGILVIFGGIIMSPMCSVYERRSGSAIISSFKLFFKGGFFHNAVQMLIGGAIWGAILFLPSHFVLLSLCAPDMPVESLLYTINVPGQSMLFWIILTLSFIFAVMFMFIYAQAVYFGAKVRFSRSMKRKRI